MYKLISIVLQFTDQIKSKSTEKSWGGRTIFLDYSGETLLENHENPGYFREVKFLSRNREKKSFKFLRLGINRKNEFRKKLLNFELRIYFTKTSPQKC